MFTALQRFIRGCVVDPTLEKKAHILADEAHKTVQQANLTLTKAETALSKAGDAQQMIILAGLGLIVAGFVAGSLSTQTTPPSKQVL